MSVMFWFVCSAAIAAWAVAEWMVAREAVRVCRDGNARCVTKTFAVTTVLADVLIPCAFLVSAACNPGEDACCRIVEWQDLLRIGWLLALTPVLSLFLGIGVLLSAVVDLFTGLDNYMFKSYAELGMTALFGVYSLAWIFMRGVIMLRAPRCSKWRTAFRTAFVCLVTYWCPAALFFEW